MGMTLDCSVFTNTGVFCPLAVIVGNYNSALQFLFKKVLKMKVSIYQLFLKIEIIISDNNSHFKLTQKIIIHCIYCVDEHLPHNIDIYSIYVSFHFLSF